jgi:hypothetical protein
LTDQAVIDQAAATAFRALQKRAREDYGSNTQPLLVVYAVESFLRRLAISEHAQRMVLKGGMLMAASDIRRMTKTLTSPRTESPTTRRTSARLSPTSAR